jgi:hypothetical protein
VIPHSIIIIIIHQKRLEFLAHQKWSSHSCRHASRCIPSPIQQLQKLLGSHVHLVSASPETNLRAFSLCSAANAAR